MKKMMTRWRGTAVAAAALLVFTGAWSAQARKHSQPQQPVIPAASKIKASRHAFDTVTGDPMRTKVYTLDNGLKIYMSVSDRTPRIQANVAVRVGGKNDPAETTGLAHYFEHMMFKGTPNFGTVDFEREKPMLDEIEQLFEVYRNTTDSLERVAIYHRIDSVSYEASKLAIPNEYDKMMAAIGANGTNAYTSQDVTCYVEDIPANELERWAIVQSDRFKSPILRGFHTELETIYEEKNMSLTRDGRKASEKLLSIMFPSHPYGTQTVLGTQTHLKNPSITNIKKYHDEWYVPNNMAITLVGDFDPDDAVDIIERYFGDMKPNANLKHLEVKPETPFTEPERAEVVGRDAEFVTLGWRIPGAAHPDQAEIGMLTDILANGYAGLIDRDLRQTQKVQRAGVGLYDLADEGILIIEGTPRQGQSLEEVESLLIGEIEQLLAGNFSDELVEAVKANYRKAVQQAMVENSSRADMYVDAFVNGHSIADMIDELNRVQKVDKQSLLDVARRYLGINNYGVVYKRQGPPADELKIAKPAITPIEANRDTTSVFLRQLVEMETSPIEPEFIDYQRDLRTSTLANGSQLLYSHNVNNELFDLIYVYETGTWANPWLAYASGLLQLTGTDTMTPAQVREAFYSLACDYRVMVGGERSYITLSGLSENMNAAIDLLDKVIDHAMVKDDTTYPSYIEGRLKDRVNSKANQQANFQSLITYVSYGPEFVKEMTISNEQLQASQPQQILGALRDMFRSQHRVLYYGPLSQQAVVADIDAHHLPGVTLTEVAKPHRYERVTTDETIVYVAPYDAKQLYMRMLSNNNQSYDPMTQVAASLYNEYFGGSMSAIVFQEMREARSLAYSAGARFASPARADRPFTYFTHIATQNDKMMDAIEAFLSIVNDMPQSKAAFDVAKQAIDSRIRTERYVDDQVAWRYISDLDLGLAPSLDGNGLNRSAGFDTRRALYEMLPDATLADVVAFQQANVKDRKFHYAILGKIEDLDLDALAKLGKVVILTPEDIFGY